MRALLARHHLLKEISEAKDFGLSLDPLLYEDKNLDEPHTCIADLNDPWDKANLSQKALNDLKNNNIPAKKMKSVIKSRTEIDLSVQKFQDLLPRNMVKRMLKNSDHQPSRKCRPKPWRMECKWIEYFS